MAIEDSVAVCKSTPESDISFLDPSGLYVIKPLPPVGQNLCLSLFNFFFFFRNENAICLLDSTCCTRGLPQGGSRWTCGLFLSGLFQISISIPICSPGGPRVPVLPLGHHVCYVRGQHKGCDAASAHSTHWNWPSLLRHEVLVLRTGYIMDIV